MAVLRIVPDIDTPDPGKAEAFYGNVLGLTQLMDSGFLQTWGNTAADPVQISFASEGGSGTPTPDLSIEVDNLEEVLARVKDQGYEIVYGPVDEPWGVRRFYVKDPFGKTLNVLQHNG